MSCNLEKALAKVNKLLATNVIKTKMFAEIKRIQFEVEAMVAAKKRMLEGPTDETYTTEKVEIDHGTDYTKLITSLENRVKDYAKYVTKDTKNINVHRSTKDANGQTKYLPFGNPFSRYTTGEVDDSILSAMFYRWVVNNEVPASFLSGESTDTRAKRLGGINSARRKIIDELKNIAGKELYYEGTARGKNLSHASTLALIADLYNKGTLTIDINSKQNVLKESGTEVKPSNETTYEVHSEVEPKKRVDTEDKTSKKATPENENFDKDLDTKLRDTLTKLYPEIKLEYTEDEIQYIDSNGNVMNQEEASNLVNYTLKVVDTLYDIGTPKKSKHGGNSQPVRSTIKLNSKENPNIEVNLTKYLAGKGVSKEQIEYMFEYMRQNNIQEIGTLDLAERLLFGLTQNVEVKTAMGSELIYMEEENYYESSGDSSNTPSKVYQELSVPGGTNYKEIEISTPNVKAKLKGHAEFATDEGIGWYRVDETTEADPLRNYDNSEDFADMFKAHEEQEATRTKTLRVLEMQSDMFQKQKDANLAVDSYITSIEKAYTTITGDEEVTSKKAYEYFENKGANIIVKEDGLYIDIGNTDTDINKAFHQILNTDNKWVRFFIKSIVQNAQRNGYEKIRFPSGETAAKVEGHDTLADIIRKKEKALNNIEKAIIKNTEQLVQAKKDNNKYKIDLHTNKLVTLNEEKATLTKELKENNIAKLAPIEGFYQVRVQNTLKKEYGTDKVKTVTDEHGNKWFELELDSKRDSQAIMLQQQGGKIKGQANIEAGTVLINSLLQSQDTLPHEYAHHYIAWFRDTQIVQEAIKKWGSEEALVQAIGEQAVKQKGEAWNWWKTFSRWLTGLVSLDSATKKELKDFLTDAFLTRADLREKVKNDTSKEETLKAAAGKSGIEGLKSQQGDAAVNSKEDLDKYTVNGAELAIDEYLAPDSTPEASTKSENSIINVEKVGKQSTKDKLNLLLKAYDSASGITIGGGYVENMQVKDGYRVSDMDEDVKKGTIEKGMYQESVADLLPKLEKRVSTYLKSYDKYYNELNRTAGVRRDIEYLLDILDKVSSEPYIADAVGIKVEEDVPIQEDTPINELIKDGIHCKNKG